MEKRLGKEILGIALLAFGLFIFLVLISFHPDDPSPFHYSSSINKIHNLFGILGSQVSGSMLHIFGLSSYLFPFIFFIFALQIFSGKEIKYLLFRAISSIFLIVSGSPLIYLFFQKWSILRFEFPEGGALGEIIYKLINPYLNKLGTLFSLTLIFLISFIIITQVSPLYVIKSSTKLIKGLVKKFWEVAYTLLSVSFIKKRRSKKTKKGNDKISSDLKEFDDLFSSQRDDASYNEKESFLDPMKKESGKNTRSGCEASKKEEYKLPNLSLLEKPEEKGGKLDKNLLFENSRTLQKKLADFGVDGQVSKVNTGPVITRYEFEPASGIKISKIMGLTDDLALGLKALSVRILAPVPGKSVVGIEIPNQKRQTVYFREIVSQKEFIESPSYLTIALGKDISGGSVITDLCKMPHLLIAGATGSGKSVALNAMICSILYKARPSEVRMLLIDPKRLELSFYEDIPHLLHPVVTDPKLAAASLRMAVEEMERRYKLLSEEGVRDIASYNKKRGEETKSIESDFEENKDKKELPDKKIPLWVIIIDELADLMMVASKEVEFCITRLAQMARAAGIHLLVATQRPSVDVITGLIKANFPARISFKVSSKVDSRTILDGMGAENLLGYGDMLFLQPGPDKMIRIHGAYLSEDEVNRIVSYIKSQSIPKFETLNLTSEKEAEISSEEEPDE
ncbi:MAG: DNA translocase FtsK 4TM domain-containing protein, partial [Thermodesulfobacteriota bacterium]|nr:DNA translocase FtsK 4TM domain-containing protein [Thermodesulfobacteriota bacterium]